ncbi:hypothetical protein GJ700_00955 [Duganella sp. FT92W]|uniref:WD40 repeat domain-containing protein n=1 Tax=Pseudoduganella rivuli TaxID=2666085 RepID=A0A7X2LS01_9BURK|nr:hypothetical protein [Pseudoduganella rivuli]MRV70289.1 hypothetical protein [Pseudoduganella rivuli]
MTQQLLAIDEGRQRLHLIDTQNPEAGWSRDMADFPLPRALQRISPQRVLVGFDRGFVELDIETGDVLHVCERWTGVTAVQRLDDGCTLVAGMDLDGGNNGINLLKLDRDLYLMAGVRREGDYVRGMTRTDSGYLLCTNDHILETDFALQPVRKLAAPGFEHAWKAHRYADGSTLVSAGYGGFMARFDADGQLAGTFGGKGQVPDDVAPFFYASFVVLENGHILVANWQGHGEDNGHKGRQLLEFSADGGLLGSWSDAEKISSLQGILPV